jgi:gliding motility-associated-like protein
MGHNYQFQRTSNRYRISWAVPLLMLGLSAKATHISGGEIYYDCLGNNQYEVTLIVYRDCFGVQLDNQVTVDFQSPCDTLSVTLNTPQPVELSQLCGLQLPNSTCNGGNLPGIEQYTYTTVVTLPPCDSWTLSWVGRNRNAAVANLVDPDDHAMYIATTLNNVVDPCDNSTEFTNIASPYVCLNYPVTYSYGAFDVDGDSLSYALVGALDEFGVPILYVPPYTGLEPISGITLDPLTGLLSFTPYLAGNWVVVVEVSAWDSLGNLIGTVMRDMQFIAYPCTNVPPDAATGTVVGTTGTAVQTGPNSVDVCESGDFCFNFQISDLNANNILTATSNVGQNLPGATFTYTGTNPITCTVCWTGSMGTAGFYPFIVTVNDGACPIPAFQTYVYGITVLPGMFIDIVAVDESCAGTDDGSVSVSVISGTAPYGYSWSNLPDTTAVVNVGAGTYTVVASDASGCVSAPATAVVNAQAQPNAANAGPDLLGCLDQLPVQLNGTVTNATGGVWSGGAGTFLGAGLSVTYQPTAAELAAGSVDLLLTTTGNPLCAADVDTVHVLLSDDLLNASVSGTDALCNGSAGGTASYQPTIPGVSYQWNAPGAPTTSQIGGLPAGNYSVTATDAAGCSVTLPVTIGQPAALTLASLTGTDETCAGLNNGSVTAVASGGTGPYAYAWSNGGTTSSITVGAGSWTVLVTDANGCAPVSGTATVNALAQPNSANAGPDLIGCMDELPLDLSGTVQNATGGQWSGGTGTWTGTGLNVQYTPTVPEIQTGSLLLFLTTTGNTNCAADVDSVVVQLSNSFLGAQITSTPADCFSTATGSATFLPITSGLSYHWNDPSGQISNPAVGLGSGTYTVTVTDPLGCDTSMSVTIAQPTALQASLTQSADPLCAASANGWATVQASGGTPGYTYQWDAAANNQLGPTASGLPAGNFSVTATDANGCTVQLSTTLGAPPPIMLSAQVPDTVCVNAPTLLSAQAAGGTGNLMISWGGIGTGTSITHSFATNQVVVVTVVDAVGCSGPVLTFPVTVLNLPAAQLLTSGDAVVCPGDTATVSAQMQGYPANVQLWWPQLGQFGTGPFSVPVPADMTLDVVATDACGNTLSQVLQLQVDEPPQFVLPPLFAEGCAPLTVQFPDTIVDGTFTYLWTFGDGASSVTEAPMHTFQAGTWNVGLTVTTALGCSSSAPAPGVVIAYAPPTAAFTASPWITDADNALITFTDQSTGAIIDHAWDFGDGGVSDQQHPSHAFIDADDFQVMLVVTDIHGCTDTAAHVVRITPVYDVTIPNGFTPDPVGGNGGYYDDEDLSNNVFYPFARFVEDFRMRIYNRWGELIFESLDIRQGWDGYYRGQLSPQDVYVYQVWLRFVDGQESQQVGDITLFR